MNVALAATKSLAAPKQPASQRRQEEALAATGGGAAERQHTPAAMQAGISQRHAGIPGALIHSACGQPMRKSVDDRLRANGHGGCSQSDENNTSAVALVA